MKQLQSYVVRLWRLVLLWADKIKLPFFQGLSLYDLMSFFTKGIIEGSVTSRASSVAYSFFLSLFPGLLFLFTLIPYIPIDGFQAEVFEFFQEVMPPNSFEAARTTIEEILTRKNSQLLSFGFIASLVFATNGISSLLANFGQTIHQIDRANFWRQYLQSLILTIFLSGIFLLSIALLSFSGVTINLLLENNLLPFEGVFWLQLGEWLILVLLVVITTSLLYYLGPTKRREFKFFSPGSILASSLILLASYGFSYYVNNFASYNKLYGSIGTLLVILLWIYVNSLVLIVGFELNAAISAGMAKQKNQIKLDIE
jgi:membrane protein